MQSFIKIANKVEQVPVNKTTYSLKAYTHEGS